MAGARARELVLEAPPALVLATLGGRPLAQRSFVSTYHDTDDRSLLRAGITLRRRVETGRASWKLRLPGGGRAHVLERVDDGQAAVPAELASLLVAHLRAGPLGPVAEVATSRTGVVVEAISGRVDIVRDEIEAVVGGEPVAPFSAIELVGADEALLAELARPLLAVGAQPTNGVPKLARVLGIPPPAEARGRRGWAETQLHEILAHDPGTRLGADPEDLHRVRVAARRLRA